MPSQSSPTPESALIERYVREHAPSIYDVSCGMRLDKGYELWFRLNPPPAPAKQVIISKQDYSTGDWKGIVNQAIQDANYR